VAKQSQYEITIEESRNEEKAFREIIPKTGLIGDYMRYTDRQESPGSFHFWTCLTLIGAILQRRAWVSKGIYNVYPPLYMVLVAPTGRCRKTRAIRLGLELVENFPWLNIMADKTTPEALVQALMVGSDAMEKGKEEGEFTINFNLDNTGLIQAPELGLFLNKQSYTVGMVVLLTHLYDCPDKYKYLTRNKKPIILNNTATSMLGGTTPDWLATSLPESAFGGGFMSRFVFVVSHVRDRWITWPEEPVPGEKEALSRTISRIRATMRGKVAVEAEGRQWFDYWYKNLNVGPVEDTNLTGFIERKPDTVLKMALALAASDCRMVITLNDLKTALALLDWTQKRMFKAFEHIELSALGQIRLKVLEILEMEGEVSQRYLCRKLGGRLQNGLQTLKQVQDLMEAAGEVTVAYEMTTAGKRPTCMWFRRDSEAESEEQEDDDSKGS